MATLRVVSGLMGLCLLILVGGLALQRGQPPEELLLVARFRDGWFGMEAESGWTVRYTQPRDRELPRVVEQWGYFLREADLYRIHLPTRRTERLLDQINFGEFSMPQNDSLVYLRHSELHRLDLKSKATQNITPPELPSGSLERFLVADDKLIFVGGDFALYRMDMNGENVEYLATLFEDDVTVVRLNQVVGEWLLYTHGDRVFRMDLTSGERFQYFVTNTPQELVGGQHGMVWIRFGFASGDQVAAFQLETESHIPIWTIPVAANNPVQVGEWVLFTLRTANGNDIFRMKPNGTARSQLTDFWGEKRFVADGRLFAVQTEYRQALYDLETMRHLFTVEAGGFREVMWLDEWIYFVVSQRGRTAAYRVRPDGSEVRKIDERLQVVGSVPLVPLGWNLVRLVAVGIGLASVRHKRRFANYQQNPTQHRRKNPQHTAAYKDK